MGHYSSNPRCSDNPFGQCVCLLPRRCYNEPRIGEGVHLEAVEIARRVVDVAADKQASDIMMLDLRRECSFADYFVLMSGDTARQMRSICEDIEADLKQSGVRLHHREGTEDAGWVLLDFGDVVVHVFAPETRQYYQLDRLWRSAPPVVRIQ